VILGQVLRCRDLVDSFSLSDLTLMPECAEKTLLTLKRDLSNIEVPLDNINHIQETTSSH
jgi:hypothetical protein